MRSYFQEGASDSRQFLPFLQKSVADLETRVTASEKEAAILVASLVKQYQPKFNVKLRDDKNFISLRLGLDHTWPRLEVARVLGRAGASDAEVPSSTARYFGPYHSATAARRALGLVNKHFQLRTCSDLELQSRKRPCLQYQIKRCPGPCVFDVDKAWYADQVRAVAMFLDGRHDELSRELLQKMKEAAADALFELAAVYRDQLRAIESVREEQRIVTEDLADRDVIGFYREAGLAEIALLSVREGRLADVMTFSLKNAEIPDDEMRLGFLSESEHYGERLDDCRPRSSCRSRSKARRASKNGSGRRCSFPSAARACSSWSSRATTRGTPSSKNRARPTTCRSGSRSCKSVCAFRRFHGASSVATSLTSAAATSSARSSRCKTGSSTKSTTARST